MAQSTLPHLSSVLVVLSETEHLVNDDYPSFHRDLGIYLKTISVDSEVVETFTFVCLVEKDIPPIGFLPSGADVWAYLSLAIG